jgi:hypothetical protein
MEESKKKLLSQKIQSNATIWVILFVLAGLILTFNLLNNVILPSTGIPTGTRLNYRVDTCAMEKDSLCFFLKADTNTISVQTAGMPRKIGTGNLTFNRNPKVMIWGFLASMMVATAFGLFLPSLFTIIKLIETFSLNVKSIVISIVLVSFIGVLAAAVSSGKNDDKILTPFAVIRKFHIIVSDTGPLNWIIYITIGLACVHILGMIIINSCIENDNWRKTKDGELLKDFQQLNDSMKFFLSSISVLVVFSIVTTSLLQQSINNVLMINDGKFEIFPSEFIYAYGLVFTIFISVIYIPVYQNLKMKGKELAEKLEQTGEVDQAFKDKLKQFDIGESPLKNLQVIFSILAPILGSVFLDFLKSIS